MLLVVPGAIVAQAARLTWPVAVAVGPALTYGVVAMAILPMGALGVPWNAWTALLALLIVIGRGHGFAGGASAARRPDDERRRDDPRAGLVVAAGVAARRPSDLVGSHSRDAGLAIDPEHLGRRLARQHHPLHPRHRPGLADAHGRAAQRRDPRRAVLPVDVPRARRDPESAHRRRPRPPPTR